LRKEGFKNNRGRRKRRKIQHKRCLLREETRMKRRKGNMNLLKREK